jgi:deoxycytidylate deaminase
MKYIQITKDNFFINQARLESLNSTDLRKSIGVVITADGYIIGRGSNQATFTWKWLQRFHVKHCIRKMFHMKRHDFYWLCPGCALFKNHSEIRAINNINSINTFTNTSKGADIYIFGHNCCCERCLDKMVKVGIKKIYITNEKI